MDLEQPRKKLFTMWSRLVVKSTPVQQLILLDNQIREEVGQHVNEAAGWFFHCVTSEDDCEENPMHYVCIGHEKDDRWVFLVRLAILPRKNSDSNNDSDSTPAPAFVPVMPEIIKDPDNELFMELDQLVFDGRERL
ncbi:hypothetical protein I4U23_016065 [Adineta vaga]|nr:hypothetical protein I4U23_016065 [Adineta vaga]